MRFLYAVSNGDRHAYDPFWQVVQDANEGIHRESMARRMRETSARACLTGIARSVGIDFPVDYQRELTFDDACAFKDQRFPDEPIVMRRTVAPWVKRKATRSTELLM